MLHIQTRRGDTHAHTTTDNDNNSACFLADGNLFVIRSSSASPMLLACDGQTSTRLPCTSRWKAVNFDTFHDCRCLRVWTRHKGPCGQNESSSSIVCLA